MRSLLFPILSSVALVLVQVSSLRGDDRMKLPSVSAPPPPLVEQLYKLAKPKNELGFSPGIGPEAQQLTETFAAHDHRKAVEALLPLLQDKRDGVAELASYIIRMCDDGVVPEHLDALKKGYRNGAGWLPYAIASLRTDEAIEFLAKEFRSDPQTRGQLDGALVSLGEKAVPFLVVGFESAQMKEAAYLEGLEHIFGEMEGKAKGAMPRLLEMAESGRLEAERRKRAVQLLIAADRPSDEVLSRLEVLAKREPQIFAEVVETAILVSGTAAAAPIYADYVDKGNTRCIRSIADLGANGRAVGPRVAGWLNHEDWEVRVNVAYALGAIGYQEQRQTLEKLLPATMDWRLACAIAQALVSLGSKESIPPMTVVARSHWHPVARKTAATGLEILEGKRKDVKMEEYLQRVDSAFVYPGMFPTEEIPGLPPRAEKSERREAFPDFEKRAPDLAKKFLNLRSGKGAGHLQHYGVVVSLPAKDGVLLGGDAGEWVGGCVFIPYRGEGTALLLENVSGIEKWREKVLVADGMYHLGMNIGMVHEVRTEGDKVRAEPWFVLPGCPVDMWISSRDQLVIECRGGTVVFKDPDTIEFYSVKVPEEEP